MGAVAAPLSEDMITYCADVQRWRRGAQRSSYSRDTPLARSLKTKPLLLSMEAVGQSLTVTGFAPRLCVWALSPVPVGQAVAVIQWLWSFSRLWVAAMSRHSARAAALPLRLKRLQPRLCLICPKTGSMRLRVR
jgi:hypothetical protein